MTNLKIKLNSESEAEEVKRLAVKAGYTLDALFGKKWSAEFCYLVLCEDMSAGFGNEIMADGDKPLSIGELWAMGNPVKEYLDANRNYEFVLSTEKDDGFIEIPEGAECLTKCKDHNDDEWLLFWKVDYKFCVGQDKEWFHFESGVNEYLDDWRGLANIIWQRDQDEPFLTSECTLNEHCSGTVKSYIDNFHVSSIERKIPEIYGTVRANPSFNDQYAEIEQVRQAIKDNVNHPSHYTQGKVECIDALESATIGKAGIEAVCVANVIKYLWRYEEKNGLEDVKKAQFYLNRLLSTLENNNG